MSMHDVIARAPGSIGNVGPGFDVLGAAVTGAGDAVEARWVDGPAGQVRLDEPGAPELAQDPDGHASVVAARAALARAAAMGIPAPATLALVVRKGLPLSAGQGGSAASSVAGAVAARAALGLPREARAEMLAAVEGEAHVAGRHFDNIAPAVLGGIVLVRETDPLDVIALPVPPSLRVVLVLPAQRLRTADARAVLAASIPRATVVAQLAQLAALVAGLSLGDLTLVGRGLHDHLAEPARAPLLPGFVDAKRAALAYGALGASIAGSGPTAFALCDGEATAAAVCAAMVNAYERIGVPATGRVASIDTNGATVEPIP